MPRTCSRSATTTSSSRSTPRRRCRTRTTPASYFKSQQLDNVLHSPGYAANAVGAVPEGRGPRTRVPADDPHRLPHDGRGWYANKDPAESWPTKLGIRVPFDEHLAARPVRLHVRVRRPEALRILSRSRVEVRGVPAAHRHSDGSLAHVQERSIATPPPSSDTTRGRSRPASTRRSATRPSISSSIDGRHDAGLPDRPDPVPAPSGWLHGGGSSPIRGGLPQAAPSARVPLIEGVYRPLRLAIGAAADDRALSQVAQVAAPRRRVEDDREEVEGDLTEGGFDSAEYSIGFLRWLMAFMVIFSHAGPLGGFYGGEDFGTQWSTEQSLGGVAVCRVLLPLGVPDHAEQDGLATTTRYFWRRIMRIFPACSSSCC